MAMMLSISSFCQDNKKEENIRVNWDYCKFAFVYRGIPFLSETSYNYSEYLQHQQTIYCHQGSKTFSVNGISLSEQDYSTLKLNKKEVDVDKCYYTEDYCGDSISRINFYAQVIIPIVINGIEYLSGDTIPLNELQVEKLKFRKEERFLRKNRILIETE